MKSLLWGIFEKPQTLARGVFETSQKRHRKNIFFEILLDILKMSHKRHLLRCAETS